MSQEKPHVVKVSVNLASHQVDSLRQSAKQRGVTVTEVIRHAISLELFLRTEISSHERIIIENAQDHTRRELVLLSP